jgi:predicted nucleic acid-binding protein
MKLRVSDTSPLLFLAKLDRLDLLRPTALEITAPEAVFREIQQHPDEASRKLEDARRSWLQARAVIELKGQLGDPGEDAPLPPRADGSLPNEP